MPVLAPVDASDAAVSSEMVGVVVFELAPASAAVLDSAMFMDTVLAPVAESAPVEVSEMFVVNNNPPDSTSAAAINSAIVGFVTRLVTAVASAPVVSSEIAADSVNAALTSSEDVADSATEARNARNASTASATVADSLSVPRQMNPAAAASAAVVVSDMLTLMVAVLFCASADVADSMMYTEMGPPPPASKYQPSEPLLVELAPAYHVVSRLYARTPVMVR